MMRKVSGMDIAQEIGARIRCCRKRKHMTAEELARAIHKSKSCVSKYEKGLISLDILSLYDIAEALDVQVTQLLYFPVKAARETASGTIPAFFSGLDRMYLYYYDGRTNRIIRSVADISAAEAAGIFRVQMYMNVEDYRHYPLCENVYDGLLTHYDSLSTLVLQNQHMEMDHYQIGVPSPYMNAPVKWGLAFGISSRPLMPTSTKVLLSKTIQEETAAFEKDLRISKEDIRLLKLYNMLTVL